MMLAPEDATIVNYRGDLQCDIGRYSDAARSYRQAIELDPNLADAYRNLAWLAATCPNQELRNPQAAMALANKMMELTPQPGDLEHDTLAAAYAISGDFPRAMAEMDKAIELAPADGVENYKWRRQLYEQQRPYITEPVGPPEGASDTSATLP
jgi:tetratricopeptide (TPR) repeat protein